MSEEQREKYWQIIAGRMAGIANWALVELLENVEVGSSAWEQANDKLNELQQSGVLEFDEEQT